MSLTNTFLGFQAGSDGAQDATAENSTAIGANAYTTASNQVALGDAAVQQIRAGATIMYSVVNPGATSSSAFMADAGNDEAGNLATVGIGYGVLANATGTTNAVAIGNLALSSNVASNGITAIGSRAMRDSIDCIDTTMVGNRAGASMTTGVGATGMGFRVLEFATQSRDTTAFGDSAFWLHQGAGGVAVGYRAAEFTTAGDESIYVGRATGVNRADGERCVFVGAEAGSFPSATVDQSTGAGAVAAGDRMVGVGYRALANTTGDDHVAVGDQAGVALTAGSGSIFIGRAAGADVAQKVDAVNSIAIGKDAYTTADDQIVLGAASAVQTVLRGKVGIGLGLTAPSGNLHVQGTSGAEMPLFVRQGTEDAMLSAFRLRTMKATNMADNFGASINFSIMDDAAVDNGIGIIGAVRKGADNTGEMQVRPFTSGVLAEGMVVRNRQAIVGWATAPAAGGTAGVGYCMSNVANFGVFFGSGAPTLSAAKGSLYMRTDGTGTNDRMYVNTDGATTWTHVVTGA